MFERKALTDAKSSWLLFTVIFLIWAILYMSKNCFSTAMAAIVSEGFMTKSQTSIITAAFWLVYAPGQIIGGIFADRKPPQSLILIAIFGASVINLGIYLFYKSYAFMLIVWCLNAALQFAAWPSVFKIVSTQLKKENRTNCIFILSLSTIVGLMFGYILSGIVPRWQDNFLVSSIALFTIGVTFLIVYNLLLKKMVPEKFEMKQQGNHHAKHEPIGSLFKRSGIIPICIGAFFCNVMVNGPKSLAPTMLVESYESMTVSMANILNAFIIASGVLNIVVGKIIYPKFLKNEALIVALMMAFAIPFFAVNIGVGRVPLLPTVCSLIFALLFVNISFTFISSQIPARFNVYGMGAMIAGLINGVAAMSNVFSSYVFAAIADKFGWTATTITWVIVTVLGCIATVVAIKQWRNFTSDNV